MNVFVTHNSACLFWRRASAYDCARARKIRAVPSRLTAHGAASVRLALEGTVFAQHEMHVSVPVGQKPPNAHGVYFHRVSHPPEGYYLQLSRGVFVASPELTFVQMGTMLSLQELVLLGYDLCGTYVRDAFDATGLNVRTPVTTPAKLLAAAKQLHGQRGGKAAQCAAHYVLANSASPMESLAAARLTLPQMYGWSGLPRAECNYVIGIPSNLRHLTSKQFLKADLCWPKQRVVLEYQSDLWHTGAARIAHDARRRNVLQALGFSVIEATRKQVVASHELDILADEIGKALHVQRGKGPLRAVEERRASADAMLAWTFGELRDGGEVGL